MAFSPFAGIANIVAATSAGAKTELQADIDKILALIPDPTSSATQSTRAHAGDLDLMNPRACAQLRAELVAFKAAIAAGA